MDLRLRVSLLARMAVALAILSSLSVVLVSLVTVVVFYVGTTALGLFLIPLGYAYDAPRLAAVAGTHPVFFAIGALVALWLPFRHWSLLNRFTTSEYLFPPSDAVSALYLLVTLVSLYEFPVETGASLFLFVRWALERSGGLILRGVAVLFLLLSIWWFVRRLGQEMQTLRTRTVGTAEVVATDDSQAERMVGRLAQHAGIPIPTVRVLRRDRPEAFTIGSGANATIAVSTGLLELLPEDELEAVLAHEVSHLANGDSLVMTAALAPVVYAEGLVEYSPAEIRGKTWVDFEVVLLRYGQFGAAILSRGREWAADAGAVALTGSPTALASALARLDDHRGVPNEDLRTGSNALIALDVLPTLSPDGEVWPFPTHPPTGDRIERLQRLAARQERA